MQNRKMITILISEIVESQTVINIDIHFKINRKCLHFYVKVHLADIFLIHLSEVNEVSNNKILFTVSLYN